MLDSGADINEPDPVTGDTVLHAALSKKYDTVPLLLRLKVDPNIPNKNNASALHLAALTQSHDAAQMLLQAKADANTQANSGFLAGAGVKAPAPGGSPIGAAVRKQDLRLAKLLIAGGARIDANALAEAVMLEDREIEDFLADECGALPSVLNKDGSSAIHVASKERDPIGWEGLNELLGWYDNAGCGQGSESWVNNTDKWGHTALMVAARQPHRGACQACVSFKLAAFLTVSPVGRS